MTNLQRWIFRFFSMLALLAGIQILFLGELSAVSISDNSKYTFNGVERLAFLFPTFIAWILYLASTIEDDPPSKE